MAVFTLNKSIQAKKLNLRTGAPLPGSDVTIPYDAVVEKIERDDLVTNFRYLGEPYRCASDVLSSALGQAATASAAPSGGAQSSSTSAAPSGLRWESVESDMFTVKRAAVPGGWLVLVDANLAFYPDPDRDWKV